MNRLIGFFIILVFCSCSNKKSSGQSDVDGNDTVSENLRPGIKNNIQLDERGLVVGEAYLTRPDSSVISDKNKPFINEEITVHLHINGFLPVKREVLIGANERIEDKDGTVLLDGKDLFGEDDDFTPSTSQEIKFFAQVPLDYYKVYFEVWDKNSKASVSGNFEVFSN